MFLGKLDHIRITPRKMGMLADQIRGKTVFDAYRYLKFSPRRKTADVILGVLQNALANNKCALSDVEEYRHFTIVEVLVGPGKTIKRFIPRAKGSGSKLLKRTCHLSLKVAFTPSFAMRQKIKDSMTEEHVHGEHCQHGEHDHVHFSEPSASVDTKEVGSTASETTGVN